MWGLLSTSNDSITANENLANKLYFCLILLANLEDLLTPVDYRSIILRILIPFLFHDMVSHWASWIIFERNEPSLNLMRFEQTRNMDV